MKRVLVLLLLSSLLIPLCGIGLLRWFPPPTTSFMLQERLSDKGAKRNLPLRYTWEDYEEISPYMKAAVVAAEDQNFLRHHGFDLSAIERARRLNRSRGRALGASTISQQVSKNLFLWRGRSYVRKALEAYLTLWIELLWDKKRILEVYLNIAEMGDGIYGVSEAAQHYFQKSARQLSPAESASLAAILPSPTRYSVNSPSPYIERRREQILEAMAFLERGRHLRGL
jgi:monofunctional biosynthetic peptidoglycan transglycosylase